MGDLLEECLEAPGQNPAQWGPMSKSRRCQADNEADGSDKTDPLDRDAGTVKQLN
jgi:hypothetical protein